MKPALRGPACSTQPPQIAAEMPSMAMKVSKMCVTCGTVQLQAVVVSAAMKPMSLHAAASALATRCVMGSQNTENP